nr:hypothetical protein CFP56_38792 [Quercus suber]
MQHEVLDRAAAARLGKTGLITRKRRGSGSPAARSMTVVRVAEDGKEEGEEEEARRRVGMRVDRDTLEPRSQTVLYTFDRGEAISAANLWMMEGGW